MQNPAKFLEKESAKPVGKMNLWLSLAFIAVFVALAAAGHPAAFPTCNRGSQRYMAGAFGLRCCGGKPYKVCHSDAMEKFYDQCNVPPSDPTMSLADSFWTLYNCLVEAMAGSKTSLSSYAEVMVGNMTAPEKAKILEKIGKVEQKQGDGPLEQAQDAWGAYFDAEYEVCGDVLQIRDGMNETEMKEYLWDPSFTCNGTKIPFHSSAIVTGFQLNYENIGKCSKAMESKYKVSEAIRRDAQAACLLIQGGVLKEDDLKNNLDFENFVMSTIPKYVPADVTAQVMKNLVVNMLKYYPNLKSDNINAVLAGVLTDPTNLLSSTVKEADRQLFSNLIATDVVVMNLYKSLSDICHPNMEDN